MQAAERRRWLWMLARILEMISLFLVKPRLQEQIRGICQGLSFRCNVGRWQTGRKGEPGRLNMHLVLVDPLSGRGL